MCLAGDGQCRRGLGSSIVVDGALRCDAELAPKKYGPDLDVELKSYRFCKEPRGERGGCCPCDARDAFLVGLRGAQIYESQELDARGRGTYISHRASLTSGDSLIFSSSVPCKRFSAAYSCRVLPTISLCIFTGRNFVFAMFSYSCVFPASLRCASRAYGPACKIRLFRRAGNRYGNHEKPSPFSNARCSLHVA